MFTLLAFLDRARRYGDIKAALRQSDRNRLADPSARSRYERFPSVRHFALPLHW